MIIHLLSIESRQYWKSPQMNAVTYPGESAWQRLYDFAQLKANNFGYTAQILRSLSNLPLVMLPKICQ